MSELVEFDKWKEVNSTIDQHREWVVSVPGTVEDTKPVRRDRGPSDVDTTKLEDEAALAGPLGQAAMKIYEMSGERSVDKMQHIFTQQRERHIELTMYVLRIG